MESECLAVSLSVCACTPYSRLLKTMASILAMLEVVDGMFYLELGEPPDIAQLSPHLPSNPLNSADDSDALSYRCIYTPLPDIAGLNHLLPSFRQRTISLIVSISLTAALAVSLASRWELLLQRKAEASQDSEHNPSTHNHNTPLNSVVEVKATLTHFKPGTLCDNIQAYYTQIWISTLVLFSCVCLMSFFVFPKLILLKCQMHKAVLLVLYLGALPTCALPEYRAARQSSPSISLRQSNTVWTVQLRGWPNTGYCTVMHFGSNKQQMFCMLVDTGSANTAIAATPDPALGNNEFYDPNLAGEDFVDVGKTIKVKYSAGEWSGRLVKDKVGFGGFNMGISHFSLISSSSDFFIEGAEWAGILGMAYQSLAKPDTSVGTVWDSVRSANDMQDVFSLQLCPPKESTLFPGTSIKQGGYMTLGGLNSSLYQTGKQLHYTKIVEERFFSILITKIAVGEKVLTISCKEFNNDKTIVDSGTTDIFFPTKVFREVKSIFTDYFKDGLPMDVPDAFWNGEQKLLWQAAHTEEIFKSFPTIYLSMADSDDDTQEFCLAIVPQLYLRQIDVQVGEADPAVCPSTSPCDAFTFGVKPREIGTVIGGNVMLGYYTVFDRENKKIGFAESTCEYRSPNTAPFITGPHSREPEVCKMDEPSTMKWDIITYSCGVITSCIAVMMIFIVVVRRFIQSKRSQKFSISYSISTKKKTMLCSKGDGCGSSGFCCTKPELEDEGYETEHSMAAVMDIEEYTPASSILRAGEDSNHELIVETPRTPASDVTYVPEEESEGTAPSVVKDEIKTEKPSLGTKKKRRRSKRRRRAPVMETETLGGGHGVLCITVNDSHRDIRQKAHTPMQCRDVNTCHDTVKFTNMPACFV